MKWKGLEKKKQQQAALRLYLLQPEYIKQDLKAILINEVAVIFYSLCMCIFYLSEKYELKWQEKIKNT